MVEVRLHGPLAERYGREWHFEVYSVGEAVQALDVARPGFREYIGELAQRGMDFRVLVSDREVGEEDLEIRFGTPDRVDIIPVVRGSSAGVRTVVGYVLMVAGAAVSSMGYYPLGNAMTMYGFSLMVGGVVEALTPVQKPSDDLYDKSLQSWTVSGPTNTADQGSPVPIIYGEVLTGGYPISAGLTAAAASLSGAGALVQILGDRQVAAVVGQAVYSEVVLEFSASTRDLVAPFTYTWTVTGFVGVPFTISGQGTPTIRITFSGTFAGGTTTNLTGTVSVSVQARDVTTAYGPNPTTTTVNNSASIALDITAVDVGSNGGE